MAYLGNSPVLSQQEYRNIDNISGSFNGVTTSFPLLVNGVAPVPAPQSSNQCLISVNGVVQKPDDTGASGFRISGGNIIFSSAPTGGQSFFGVILAGADYIYAGENFPDGTVSAPSITFAQDTDTGFFRSGAGEIKYTANGTAVVTLSSNNLTAPSFIPTSSSAPTNGVYLPAANTVAISTGGSGRLFVDASGRVGINKAIPSQTLQVVSATGGTTARFENTSSGNFVDFYETTGGTRMGYIGHTSATDMYIHNDKAGPLIFDTNNTERLRITSAGLVGVGTSSPSTNTEINAALDTGASLGLNEGQLSIGREANSGGAIRIGYDTTNNFGFISSGRVGVSWDKLILNAGGGNIGIGNSSPGSYNASSDDLVVGDHVGAHGVTICSQNNSSGYIMFADGTTGAQTYAGQITYDHANNRLTLGTNDGTTGLTIDSSQRVGIGTTSPSEAFTLGSGNAQITGGQLAVGVLGTSGLQFINNGTFGTVDSNPLVFRTAATERARIDTSGRLLVGTSSTFFSSEFKGYFAGDSNSNNGGIVVGRFQATSGGSPIISLVKSRGASIGTNTIVSNGDEIGRHVFLAADGTNYIQAAEIRADVDGTPGTNDMPGRLVFSTTADGASSPTERLRIANNGAWGLAGANYGTSGQVLKSNGSGSAPTWQNDNGKILQVVQTVKTDTFSRTSSSSDYGAITGLSVSITPSSASNKVLIIARVSVGNSNDNNRVAIRLTYGGSPITDYQGASAGSRINAAATVQVNGLNSQEELTLVYLHSPSTTSSITYGVQGSGEGTSTFYCNRSGSDTDNNTVYRSCSSIMAMEVAP